MENFKRRLWGVLFLFMAVVLLNGCILKSTPSTQSLSISAGDPCTFSIKTLGTPTNVVWTLDTVIVSEGTALDYIYTPKSADIGDHTLLVTETSKLGKGTHTWTIQVIAPVANSFLHYTLPDQFTYSLSHTAPWTDEAADLFSAYTLTEGIDYGGGLLVSGYALPQFVDKNIVNAATPDPDNKLGTNDARDLYSVVIRSNKDSFSNRTKFVGQGLYNNDLGWDQFIQGYVLDLNYSGKSFFPASLGLANMYNNKYAYDIYMFRKINVKRPDAAGSLAAFETQATTDSYVDDTAFTTATGLTTTKFTVTTMSFGAYTDVKVIALDQFLTDYVTDTPDAYTYKIVAVDGFSRNGWTYANMQQAYYLPDYDFIVQVDGSNNIVSGTKINYPIRIEVISGSPVAYDYSTKNPPAFAAF